MVVQKPCLHIEQAGFGFMAKGKPVEVLRAVNAAFYPGQLTGMVGVNGAGKSTLIRSISGLQEVLSGRVLISDLELKDLSFSDLAKHISIVLTERPEGFNLNAFDLVAAGQMPYTNAFHQLKEEHLKTIQEAIEQCGLKGHEHKLLYELSDGLFQKAIVAKALAQGTPLMALDEPTAFLDYASKHELFILLKQLCETKQKCVLVSSHDLDLLLRYCDSILLVYQGKAELLSVEKAKEHPAFKAIGGKYLP